jgi:hypothetical protein
MTLRRHPGSLCQPDCPYRGLYEGSQSSLTDMSTKQAGALNRVTRVRAGVVDALKRTYPGAFAAAEHALGARMSSVDDEILLAYLDAFLSAGALAAAPSGPAPAPAATPAGLADLRDELLGLGVAVPEGADLTGWAAAVAALGGHDVGGAGLEERTGQPGTGPGGRGSDAAPPGRGPVDSGEPSRDTGTTAASASGAGGSAPGKSSRKPGMRRREPGAHPAGAAEAGDVSVGGRSRAAREAGAGVPADDVRIAGAEEDIPWGMDDPDDGGPSISTDATAPALVLPAGAPAPGPAELPEYPSPSSGFAADLCDDLFADDNDLSHLFGDDLADDADALVSQLFEDSANRDFPESTAVPSGASALTGTDLTSLHPTGAVPGSVVERSLADVFDDGDQRDGDHPVSAVGDPADAVAEPAAAASGELPVIGEYDALFADPDPETDPQPAGAAALSTSDLDGLQVGTGDLTPGYVFPEPPTVPGLASGRRRLSDLLSRDGNSDAPEVDSPTPGPGPSRVRSSESVMRQELFPTSTLPKAPRGRKPPRVSRVVALPPDARGLDVPITEAAAADDGKLTDAVYEKLLASVCIPRPVFMADLVAQTGDAELVAAWEQRLRRLGGESPVRFITSKRRHNQRGALVLPHEEKLRAAMSEFTRSWWAAAIGGDSGRGRMLGAQLYEVACVLHRFGDQVVSFKFRPKSVQLRLNGGPRGLSGVVIVLGADWGPGEGTRTEVADAVEELLLERLTTIALLTYSVAGQPLDKLSEVIQDEARERGWKPATPVIASTSWDYAADSGSSALVVL